MPSATKTAAKSRLQIDLMPFRPPRLFAILIGLAIAAMPALAHRISTAGTLAFIRSPELTRYDYDATRDRTLITRFDHSQIVVGVLPPGDSKRQLARLISGFANTESPRFASIAGYRGAGFQHHTGVSEWWLVVERGELNLLIRATDASDAMIQRPDIEAIVASIRFAPAQCPPAIVGRYRALDSNAGDEPSHGSERALLADHCPANVADTTDTSWEIRGGRLLLYRGDEFHNLRYVIDDDELELHSHATGKQRWIRTD